ncbi:hypothetical protein EYF80_013181 [Liparis tanakae]|uniref:Uncharacterized protein n=1 Tax=Liparis tanakae TaxID=230148 RepID=A0A4Z2IFH0_9TELE|nr:hypothetical protein EYF80_013181 [Liparis tanakae]
MHWSFSLSLNSLMDDAPSDTINQEDPDEASLWMQHKHCNIRLKNIMNERDSETVTYRLEISQCNYLTTVELEKQVVFWPELKEEF